MATIEELERRVAELERRLETVLTERVGVLEDVEAIKRVQRMYGYYLDALQYDAMAELFANQGASIEIGQRGRYEGKETIRRFLFDVLGTGRAGLAKNQVINHMQHQIVVTVDPDRRRAKARCRALIQASILPANVEAAAPAGPRIGGMMWAEGVYENTYVKEDGRWKIANMWWSPTFYVQHPYERLWFDSAAASRDFPPQAQSAAPLDALGRVFVPYHYRHPITGADVTEVTAAG